MAEHKKSFVLYTDMKASFDILSDEEAGQLVKHLFDYVNDLNPSCNGNRIIEIAFEPIKQTLKRDLKEWERLAPKRSEKAKNAGLASGEARRNKANSEAQSELNELGSSKRTKRTVSVSVSVSVIKDIVSFLNNELGKDFKDNSKSTISLIESRFKEGYTFEDFKKVITTKKANWINTDMAVYLRPSTLFGSKFESYLNEPVKTSGVTVMGLPAEVEYEYFAEYNQKWYSLSAYKNAAGDAPGENIPKRIKK